ncbi:hypothetical protein GCM10009104_26400 [Marinobacterium maritimum]|uniref:Lipoprotein n=1 Tax=Marinobacterium maritimum TaxID=500162 RepID=A0ABN1I8D9_9GAMM
MRNHWAVRLGSLLLVVVVLVGCSREPERYDFEEAIASTPAPLCLGTTL